MSLMRYKILLYLTFVNVLYSQTFLDLTPRPSYDIQKIDTPIKIDGKLDDLVWESAQIATGFTDTGIFQGKKSAFKTEVKALYDNENLLFSDFCVRLNLMAVLIASYNCFA